MRFLVKKSIPSESGERSLPPSQSSYEIPNGTITWVTVIYLFINVGSGLLSNYIVGKPQREINLHNTELINKNFELQLIQRCLELEKNEDRKASLMLLIETNAIGGKDTDKLYNYIKKEQYIPKWPTRMLEHLSSYIQPGKEIKLVTVPQDTQVVKPELTSKDNFKSGSSQSTQR
nr:hypothetical protein [uncultured Flavobacterium sp.]